MSVVGVLDGTLAARWSLGFEDLALLNAKPAGTRLGFAAQLMMYRTTGRFGRAAGEFPGSAIAYLAEQIGVTAADLADYDWLGRSGRRHRAEIDPGSPRVPPGTAAGHAGRIRVDWI